MAFLLPVALAAEELRFEVRRERALKDHFGILTVNESGILWQQIQGKAEKREALRWAYTDIQQLWISPGKLVLVTYEDRKWLLGIDREYEFFASPTTSFEPVYALLRNRLDQRLVAAIAPAAPVSGEIWAVPAKLLGAIEGSQGTLRVTADGIVFETTRKGQSRIWRDQDIENVSTSGPYQLTLTTYERSKAHYGSLRSVNFQLKEHLDDKRFDLLWKRLNRPKGLPFLTALDQ